MRVDLNKYVINRKFAQDFYKAKSNIYDLGIAISLLATITGCPCVVIAFYLGEDIGFSIELVGIISRLGKFYGYTEFIGAPESYYEALKNSISVE